jgi:hypothetical protein
MTMTCLSPLLRLSDGSRSRDGIVDHQTHHSTLAGRGAENDQRFKLIGQKALPQLEADQLPAGSGC